MDLIERTDTITLECSAAKVFPVLLDVENYGVWWPRRIRFKLSGPMPATVGTKIRISNGPWVVWTATICGIVPESSMVFEYGGGAWTGKAEWTVRDMGGHSEVAYHISILPAPFWLRMLGKVLDLGKLHSKEMEKVLLNLKSRVLATV